MFTRRILISIAISLFLLQSCINPRGVNAFAMWRDGNIKYSIKAEIDEVSATVYESILANNYSSLSACMSDTLKSKSGRELQADVLPKLQQVLNNKPKQVFGDFYVTNSNPVALTTLFSGEGDNAYTFIFTSNTKKSYLRMYLVGDSSSKAMLTLIYGNYGGKWKLNALQGGPFSLMGRNAVELYSEAQKLYKMGYLMDAANVASLCQVCGAPAAAFFQYKNAATINGFCEKVKNDAQLKDPMPHYIESIATKPKIFSIRYEMLKEGFFPLISYLTSVDIHDTVRLKTENVEIQKSIGKIYYGLDKVNAAILYKAYSEMPVSGMPTLNYSFVARRQ